MNAAPDCPWIMAMQWHHLLFAHWPFAPADLRPLIPAGLELDTFNATAWIGVVPFEMRDVRPRSTPALPWIGRFAELNVRTYVTVDGKPGVWFWSLDAANPLAVRVARRAFHLPYFDARMQIDVADDVVSYRSVRTHRGAAGARWVGQYRPIGPPYRAHAGTLDHWLTERYCLYAGDRRGHVWRGDIQHQPWPLQPASATIAHNTMFDQIGLVPPDQPPLLHYARRLDVVAWLVRRVR